jgi:nucleotide-binding universal stress UspA family protein
MIAAMPSSTIQTVLLATDLTSASEVATDQAIELAGSIGARLLVVHVMAQGRPGDPSVTPRPLAAYDATVRLDQRRARHEASLLSIVERARARGADAAFLLWTGEPGLSIVAASEAEEADLIVVGTRGLDDAGRSLLGSVSDFVVHHGTRPVLVAH